MLQRLDLDPGRELKAECPWGDYLRDPAGAKSSVVELPGLSAGDHGLRVQPDLVAVFERGGRAASSVRGFVVAVL